MVVSTEELLDIASEAGYRNISTELIAEWVEIGLLDSPTQVNSGAGNGSVSVDLWPDSQRDLFLQLLIYKSSTANVAALASLPVVAWMYWDDDHVPLRQAKIALKTFWKPDRHMTNAQRTMNDAWTIVNTLLGEEGTAITRERLQRQILRILNLQESTTESVHNVVDDVLRQLPDHRVGPHELDVDTVTEMVSQFASAMAHYDHFTDDDFNEARARLRLLVLGHLHDRPKISEDPTPEDWFNQIDYTFLVHNACRDLILGLGHIIVAARRGETLTQSERSDWRGLSVEVFGSGV
jgi:hypothetical protein